MFQNCVFGLLSINRTADREQMSVDRSVDRRAQNMYNPREPESVNGRSTDYVGYFLSELSVGRPNKEHRSLVLGPTFDR